MNNHSPSDSPVKRAPVPVRSQTPPGITIGDIWYVLFRRKWLILTFLTLGILGSGVIFVIQKPAFFSECKIFVRYVVEAKSMDGAGPGSQVKMSASSADSIMNSELEILTSLDLCEQVAAAVGPDKILGAGGGSNLIRAASLIYVGLQVEAPRRSSVIRIRLSHPDPQLVQPLLTQLLDAYFRRHKEIHRAVGSADTILSQQADQLRGRLVTTEEEIRKLKSKAGILSIEDSKKAYTEQYANIRNLLLSAQADLAECQVLSGQAAPASSTNELIAVPPTNQIAAALSTNENATAVTTNQAVSSVSSNAAVSGLSTNPVLAASSPGPSREKLEEYRNVCLRIGALRNNLLDLRATYTEESRVLARLREQIASVEKTKKRMEEETPELRSYAVSTGPASPTPAMSGYDLYLSRSRSLEARTKVLQSELDKIRAEMVVIEDLEASITQLQRRKELEETNYRYFAAGLEQARISEAFEVGQLANIGVVQAPSPPVSAVASRLKSIGMILLGSLFAGLGLAFLIELVVDRTVRRPFQVETGLLLPLFFSIPRLHLNGRTKRFLPKEEVPSSREGEPEVNSPSPLVEWTRGHPFRSHLESLRDRLLMHFEGDGHKPKLIGLTSCREGAGVTTLALGLASALSETGDGKVLFVNLDFRDHSLHPFFRGKPVCGLNDLLDNKESGGVSRNLYLADASSNGGNAMESLPRNISRIMPKLKLSDYDFIVFDLPRVTHTSITPRLAGMMDLVLMVVESEKEPQEMVKRAAALMHESQARVSVVLNKLRSFVPARLHREL